MEDENQRFSRLLTAHLDKVKQQVKKLMEAACAGDIKLFKSKFSISRIENTIFLLYYGVSVDDCETELAKGLDRGKGLAATVASVKDGKERGALSFAATEGQLKMCKYLVEELKIDVNDRDKEGQTPVLCAAREGHTATVQYLIEKGHIELVKLLLSKGVDVDLQSDAGTPLMWAAGLGQEDAVKVLLEHHANAGANVNVKTGEATRYGETTPLLIAAHNGNAEIVNCLLQAGADPNAADEDGNKPIHVAATRGNRAAVEALLAVTPQIQSVPEWSVDGVIEFMQSDYRRKQESTEAGEEANYGANLRCLLTRLEAEFKGLKQERIIPKKDLPEVTPEAKKKAAAAKAKGDEAFKRNDFPRAINAYAQAINFDPTDGTLFSNRSLCWLRLGQGESALVDAKACRELRPDWAKGCYRHGAALRLLQACPSLPGVKFCKLRFKDAANAFYEGIQIDPENKELVTAFRIIALDHDGKGLAATVANVKDAKKRGSLHFAAGEGKIDLCKYLMEDLKIDVNEKDKEGETAVLNAARHGHTATVQYLIYKGADPAILSTSGAALHNAARNGHIELVELFLLMGVDIDLKSDVGTSLMWAVDHSQEDVVKVLLERHANFNQVGDDNISPLQAAVAADSFPCMELLVKAGANVNVKAGEGMWCGEITPLLVKVMQKVLNAYYKLELILISLIRNFQGIFLLSIVGKMIPNKSLLISERSHGKKMVTSQYILQLEVIVGSLLKLYWPVAFYIMVLARSVTISFPSLLQTSASFSLSKL
ncbi:hypothetical protein H5410_011597 [Solanum commersonii]|uniref:Serine/threonine-protein kinase BSK1-like TPR repeats domain-containing protein n=1 Tax=Solanum commersonii TaxID=4109 RepID=A0A9J6AQ42_SOLCO|nr:hypothetical protein H5410_011597 [Solanum commersonii]